MAADSGDFVVTPTEDLNTLLPASLATYDVLFFALTSGELPLTTNQKSAILAFVQAGDHVLMVDSVYGPTRRFCDAFLDRFGVETTYYDPLIRAGIADLMRMAGRRVRPQIDAQGNVSLSVLEDEGLGLTRKDGRFWLIDGEKGVVLHGDSADRLIVSARIAGKRRERNGIALFLVDADARGVVRRGYPTVDGQRAAEIELLGVRVDEADMIGTPGEALPVIERVVDDPILPLGFGIRPKRRIERGVWRGQAAVQTSRISRQLLAE